MSQAANVEGKETTHPEHHTSLVYITRAFREWPCSAHHEHNKSKYPEHMPAFVRLHKLPDASVAAKAICGEKGGQDSKKTHRTPDMPSSYYECSQKMPHASNKEGNKKTIRAITQLYLTLHNLAERSQAARKEVNQN